jgi:uncharacterized protein (DUF302 family)
MHTESAFETYVVEDRLDRALKVIRSELNATEVDVVREFDLSEVLIHENGLTRAAGKVLLVDDPFLVFEALALDRAAAVFFPLHVLVMGMGGGRTQVSIAAPSKLLNARFPAGAVGPIERLVGRVELALKSAAARGARTEALVGGET